MFVLRRLVGREEDAEGLLQLIASKILFDLWSLLSPALKSYLPFPSRPGLLLLEASPQLLEDVLDTCDFEREALLGAGHAGRAESLLEGGHLVGEGGHQELELVLLHRRELLEPPVLFDLPLDVLHVPHHFPEVLPARAFLVFQLNRSETTL